MRFVPIIRPTYHGYGIYTSARKVIFLVVLVCLSICLSVRRTDLYETFTKEQFNNFGGGLQSLYHYMSGFILDFGGQ